MHVVVELMNAWLVHRHLLSVDEQPARSADAMHVKAHSMGVVQSIYMLVNVSMKERTRHGLAGDKGGGGSAGESEGSEEAHLGLCSVIKGSLRERMRTATTTKDGRRGGAVGRRKSGATDFIPLPMRSQDHLIITFPTQLYLGREFDVSIRIEIGMIPIRTTLAHTANIMGPRDREHYSGHSLHALSPGISAWVHCTTIKPLCLLFPFCRPSLSRAQEQRRLFCPLPTAGGEVCKLGTPFHCSDVLRLQYSSGHRRAPGPLCVCVGDGHGHQICEKDPVQNVRRLDLLSMLILPSRNFSEPVHTRTFLHQALPHTQEQTACIVLLKVLD